MEAQSNLVNSILAARQNDRAASSFCFGQPVQVGDVTIISVSEAQAVGASLGGGGGGRRGRGGGHGAAFAGRVRPLGFLTIRADGATFTPLPLSRSARLGIGGAVRRLRSRAKHTDLAS